MTISLNNKAVKLPSSLREMTLQQRIDFQAEHGNILDDMLKSVMEIEDELDRELEISQFQLEKMFRTSAFFLGATVEALKESNFVDQISNIYVNCLGQMFEENIDKLTEFVWKNEEWEIASPELKQGDKMKFGEFIDSKQIVQNMIGLGKNKWECLVPLAAIFFRKKGEEYKEEFLYEGSDRLKLMKELPMDIALSLTFFLSNSLNMYMEIFQSSNHQELKDQEKI